MGGTLQQQNRPIGWSQRLAKRKSVIAKKDHVDRYLNIDKYSQALKFHRVCHTIIDLRETAANKGFWFFDGSR